VWSDSLKIGVALLDDEHKALVQRLNDVSAAVAARKGETEIPRTLSFLSDYARQHFANEERAMRESAYPGLADQQRAHAEFITALKKLEQDYEEEGPTRELANSVDQFLSNWLGDHIRGLDRRLGDFLKTKRA
jgi:hemerythrin